MARRFEDSDDEPTVRTTLAFQPERPMWMSAELWLALVSLTVPGKARADWERLLRRFQRGHLDAEVFLRKVRAIALAPELPTAPNDRAT